MGSVGDLIWEKAEEGAVDFVDDRGELFGVVFEIDGVGIDDEQFARDGARRRGGKSSNRGL